MRRLVMLVLGLLMTSSVFASSLKLYSANAAWEDKWLISISERDSRYQKEMGLSEEMTISCPAGGAITLKFDHGATITQLRAEPTCAILSPKGSKIRDTMYLLYPEDGELKIVNLLDVVDFYQGEDHNRVARFAVELADGNVIIKRSFADEYPTPEEKKKKFIFPERELVAKCKGDKTHVKQIELLDYAYLNELFEKQ
jgi:hypothetical protein